MKLRNAFEETAANLQTHELLFVHQHWYILYHLMFRFLKSDYDMP